eukprot:superscaffoldBa00000107_g1556
MTTSPLPFLDTSDPRLKLRVENRRRNIFVTQPEDTRHREEENVNLIPVVTETSSRVLEAGVNTLQKTLVLKKQAELEEVEKQLTLKRQEFKSCVQALTQRRSELEMKQQQTKERAMKFEKFVAENEAKRRQALKKYEAAQEQNILKQREIEELTTQLKQLRARQQVLKERMAKYKIYEDYLIKTLDYLPSNYFENGSESLVMPIIRRHETLSITHQELLQRLWHLEEEVDQGQRQLQTMKQDHSIKKLMANKELSELQSELESLKEKNKQAEVNLLMEQGQSRQKVVEEEGSLLMAINNLAEQCYLPAYGPLENMNVLMMMDMVKMEAGSLVSCREDISAVFPEETPDAKYNDLSSQFSSVRKVRGDGNCFYRAFCFAHLESVLHSARALQRFKDQIIQTSKDLTSAGFDESSFRHHLNTVINVVEQCQADEQEETLFRLFNEQVTSDSVVQYLRLLTSAHLQNHADFFCNFVEAPNLQVYCHQEVEVMAMECDHVDILALTQALDVCIHIVSMEGDEQELAHHIIPEAAEPSLHLLYQTSHYNILYPRPRP